MPPAYRDPCNGHFPHRQAVGCCPIEITNANRAQNADGLRSATVGTPVPSALSGAVTTQDLAYLNTADHTPDDGFDVQNSTVDDLVVAAQSGTVDAGTILGELARRIPGAADADGRGVLTSSITAIKALIDTGVIQKSRAESNGNYLRLWGLSVKKVKLIDGPLTVIDAVGDAELTAMGAGSGATTNKSKILLPRVATDTLFKMAVYQWSVLAHVYGIMQFEISSHFFFEVVFLLEVKHGKSFWTCQEYLIECLDLLDKKVCTASNVYTHDRNVMLSNAEKLGEAFAQHFARKSGEAPPTGGGGDARVWNGKFQPATSKANLCQAYNRNKAHDNPKYLTKDGACIFRHLCNRWVSDKGPSGKCLAADHGWHNCTNPNKTADAKPHEV